MMTANITFGEWIKRRRRMLDLTQQELAQQVGCAVATIRKIEADERHPSKQLATRLADSLHIPPEEHSHFITFARSDPYLEKVSPPADSTELLPGHLSLPRAFTAALPSFIEDDSTPEPVAPIFVTRTRELSELEAILNKAQAGEGQLLFVVGGAGRGKTMLVQEFARRAQATDADLMVVSGYCNAHTGIGDPYLPFREALTMLTGDVEAKWAGGLITAQHARRLWQMMPITIPALVEHAPDLISSFVPGPALQERAATFAPDQAPWFNQLATITAGEQRARLEQQRIFAQYTSVLKAISRQRPLLFIIDDLHWVDTASSSLLFHLSRQIGDSRILIIGIYRPEEVALSWGQEQHPLVDIVGELKRQHGNIWLDLSEMAPVEGRHFLDAYLDTQPNQLGDTFRAALFQHTGGHPLFTVELLRDMQERGDLRHDEEGRWVEGEGIDWQTLPARVEGVIEKRIGRLEPELQAVLAVASVEGESFTAEVVARVQQLNEGNLVRQLSRELDKRHRLVTAQALERLGQQRLSRYRFRHYLFQQYLYSRLDELERTYLHEAVGKVLETLYGDAREQAAVQLAWHFEQAGLTEQGVDNLRLAGERAVQLSANEEAVGHFNQALKLLKTLPDTPERAQQELALQIALGVPLQVTKGPGAVEVGNAYRQARQLCRQAGQPAQLFQALWGLWRFYRSRAEFQTARELADELLSLAQQHADPALMLQAHHAQWTTLINMGALVAAQEHIDQGIALYAPQHHATAFLFGGHDPGVCAHASAAFTLWSLGYPDQALASATNALTLAQELSHAPSLAIALENAAGLHKFRREAHHVQTQAEALITLATEQRSDYDLATGTALQGWALAELGQREDGLARMRQGLASRRPQGSGMEDPHFLALPAEALLKSGHAEEGLSILAEALAVVTKSGMRFWEAEAHRLKGELLLRQGGAKAEAEACFRQALHLARRQSAKSVELRAAISLSRLLLQQGIREEARYILAEIYGWFTEGFDTLDLTEAKALLEILS